MAFSETPTYKRRYKVGETTVSLNGSGTGSTAVLFTPDTFIATPQFMVVAPNGDTGTYAATSTSTTGFTVSVTTSIQLSRSVVVTWFAAEKGP